MRAESSARGFNTRVAPCEGRFRNRPKIAIVPQSMGKGQCGILPSVRGMAAGTGASIQEG
jgi:hypothetical protein